MKNDPKIEKWLDDYGTWMVKPSGNQPQFTQLLFPYEQLFSPITINKLKLKNRIVMAPMGNIDMCEETGRPNDKMLQYFFERAKGGVGLITTGLIPISFGIDPSLSELDDLSYFPRIDRSRTVMAGWRDLAQGIHNYGSRLFVQLTPGLGRVGNPQCLLNEHRFPVSASFNPNFYMPAVPCLPLSDRKLNKIIKNAGQAAADALAMGIDGVYLHGHEGYLLEQLTNRAFNRRVIGKYADWQRFGIEMVKTMRQRTNAGYPIMYRIDISLALNETYNQPGIEYPLLKKFQNGRTINETLDYMVNLVKAGVDAFDVDMGCYDNWWLPHPPGGMPAGCYLPLSQLVKEHFDKLQLKTNTGQPVVVIAVGKLGYPDLAEQALRDNQCDMVMLGRQLLADPEWANKAYTGQVSTIRPCIGCQEGCINEFVDGGHPQCAVNPRSGFEHLLPQTMPKPEHNKRVAVIGGGPAGVMSAIWAAKRGHTVDLFEATASIGGKLKPGTIPKIKYDLANYLEYLQHELQEHQNKYDLQVNYHTKPTVEQLKKGNYDAIITAIGSMPVQLKIPGLEKINHVSATELLMNPEIINNVKKVVIIGGGVVGCETAHWLAYEHNLQVTVVEMQPHFMNGVCTANRGYLLHYLQKKQVELINCAKVEYFDEHAVHITMNISKNVPNPYNTWQPILPSNIINPLAKPLGTQTTTRTIPADLVVIAAGETRNDELYDSLVKQQAAQEIFNIGDSQQNGRVLEAIRQAYAIALKL